VNLVAWASRRTALVWLGVLALAGGGLALGLRLPSGIYPEVEFPRIAVVARGGDAPPEVTQINLARPLETALATVMGLERIRSRTIRGATELSLLFAPGTDMWRALQLVESRLGEARSGLPAGVDLTAERLTTSSFPIVTFNLSGKLDPRRLRELGEFVLRPAISRVRGVGRVDVLGGDVREVEVVLDPARAAALRLRPSDVAEKLRAHAVLSAVGRVDDAHQLVTVVVSSEPRSLDDLRELPVAVGPEGGPIRLSAVATIEEGAEDRMTRVGGPGGETVLISVGRLPGASTPDVVARVLATTQEMRSALPAGVKLTVVYDQAQLVGESMRSVRDAILIGIVLCVAVIALFLRNVRAGLVAAVAVPLTLGATFLVIAVLGQTLNLMSLGGMAVAIGLVIDDAIVVVEAIGRRLEEGAVPAVAAEEGTRSMFAAVLGTTATTIVVFIPLAWLEGVVGRFFSALAVTLCAAVAISFVMAVVVVPVAATRWLVPRPIPPRSRYAAGYLRLLSASLRRPWMGVALVAALIAVGVVSALEAPSGFLPSMDEGAFVLDYFLPAGTSLTDTDRVARKIEAVLEAHPAVATFSRRTGAELGPAAATEISRGDIMVRLRSGHRPPLDEVLSELRAQLARDVPEARTEFMEVLQDVLNDLAGTPRPIELKLSGDDYTVLRRLAQEVAQRIEHVEGLVDLFAGFEGDAPELRFRVDAGATARLGRTPADVAADLEVALRGVVASSMRRFDRPLGIRVRYPDAVRFDASAVLTLPLSFGPAGTVPVSAVAAPEREGAPTSLTRENLRPVVIVTADHEHRDLGSVMRDVQTRLRGLALPEGYHLELGGQYEGQQETFRNLAAVMGFGLVAVLLVLLVQFRSVRLALVVLLSAPLAIVGAVATLWITGTPLNASSLMGCVLLIGLVVKNGILLLEHAERAREQGASLEESLHQAGEVRVRPVLMTTVATLCGLLPLALGLGSGAELQRPLALAVIGGLVISTAISLLVLPALVVSLSSVMARFQR
jgi:CzcA family heavy metal efflux pump